MALDIAKIKPGQDVQITVTKAPRAATAVSTIERLMRLDPANKRALRHAQRLRGQRINKYIRGNREWTSREKPARVVRAVTGATWTLPFTAELADELLSVGKYLKVESK
jgi:SHS2 domain-containing protein